MAKPNPIITLSYLSAAAILLTFMPIRTGALMPYTKSLWEMMLSPDDPFRILEQSPMTIPRDTETLALARADWKETATAHAIVIDIPGIKKEDVKIEVEENRVLRISGERKAEQEAEGEKWHRAERARGRFWRQFRLPANADLDRVEAHIEDGVLGITVPKFAEERRRQPKVIRIEEGGRSGEDIRAVRAEM